MFDIGWSELLVVGLVALIVVGPKELPGMMKRIGQMIRKAKHTASNFQRQFEEAMDEGELGELKDSVKGIRDELDPHKIMGDMAGDDVDDDFDLEKWNEQILEDEKKRTENPIRTKEEMEATIGEADAIGAEPGSAEPLDREILDPEHEMQPLDEAPDPQPIEDVKQAQSRQVT